MRTFWLAIVLTAAIVSGATAQTSPRFTVGPVVRGDRVAVERDLNSLMPVFGVSATARLTNTWGLEGEITRAAGSEFVHSYEAVSQHFAPANATAAEMERLGVKARWRYGYRPATGGSIAVTARAGLAGRADLVLRLGFAMRRYTEARHFTVLSIPPGIDPSRVTTVSFGDGTAASNDGYFKVQRGGLLVGVGVPVTLTRRLAVSADVQYVYGGPASFTYKHNEVSLGLRARWGL